MHGAIEKGIKMGSKFGAKSIRNRAGAAEAFGERVKLKGSFWDPFWDQFCAKIGKIPSEKASTNQSKMFKNESDYMHTF